jgi:hypothetical protein
LPQRRSKRFSRNNRIIGLRCLWARQPRPQTIQWILWHYGARQIIFLRSEERKESSSAPIIGVNRIHDQIPNELEPRRLLFTAVCAVSTYAERFLFFIITLFYSATSAPSAVQKNILTFSGNILIFGNRIFK